MKNIELVICAKCYGEIKENIKLEIISLPGEKKEERCYICGKKRYCYSCKSKKREK